MRGSFPTEVFVKMTNREYPVMVSQHFADNHIRYAQVWTDVDGYFVKRYRMRDQFDIYETASFHCLNLAEDYAEDWVNYTDLMDIHFETQNEITYGK